MPGPEPEVLHPLAGLVRSRGPEAAGCGIEPPETVRGGFREKAQLVGKEQRGNNPLAGLFGVTSPDGPETSELGHIP